jgi:hypothetical protein
MASTGAAAWAKYYQGRGDLATTIKRAGNTYDADGKATSTQLAAGTPCIVLASTVYDSKPQIRVKIGGRVQVVRFKFDDITKPGNKASAASSLKPQAFNVVTAAPIQLADYRSRALAALDERTDLDGPLKGYLAELIKYWAGENAAKTRAAKIWSYISNDIPINDINKDFGEVLGPLAVLKHNLLAGTGHDKEVNATSGIYIPARPNEPLMDYKVGPVVISAKSGTTTNTVKAADILGLLAKRSALVTKYSKTKEYQVLATLAANSTITGPIAAAQMLMGTAKFNAWIRNNTYLKGKKGKYTDNELMYECEKYLQAESKTGSLNFTKMFADAIKGNVVYVKFELDQTGVGKFETIVAADVIKAATGARPYLRSKNGYTRASDKLGIQI